MGESGYDKGVYFGWTPPRGWRGNMNTETYLAQLAALDAYYKDDARVHSAQVYLWDYDNNQWDSFAMRWDREAFLAYVNSVRGVADTNRVTTYPTYPPGVVNPLPPTTGVPPQSDTLAQVLFAEAERRQVLRFNHEAALQKAIFAGDLEQFTPNSPEFWVTHEGKVYVGQRAENGRGRVRVFYCRSGDWGNVRHVEKGAA
jgi:hypothetical protein